MVRFEYTVILVKPDYFKDEGSIARDLSQIGKIVGYQNNVRPTEEDWEAHYEEHKEKPFFRPMINNFANRNISIIVLAGDDMIAKSRRYLGATDPREADDRTIRGMYCYITKFEKTLEEEGFYSNVVHGSDSRQSAKKELNVWRKYLK